MTVDEIRRWVRTKKWEPTKILVAWEDGVPLERHRLVYAECAGADDPVCGRARFSRHGCGGAPTRAEYLAAIG